MPRASYLISMPDLPNENTDRLVYRFSDASVPPQYHRSYTITVIPEKADLSVDSYGTILSTYSASLKKNDYEKFIAALLALGIHNREYNSDKPCVGGTADNFDINIAMQTPVKGTIYHCGGKSEGTLSGNVAAAVELFKALIPNIKKKTGK